MTSEPRAGSGVPNVGEPERSAVEDRKLPKMTGAPRPFELGQRTAGHRLGERLGDRPGAVTGPMAAAQNERHHHRALVGAGIGAQRPAHRSVEDQRRIGVDIAHYDAVRIDEVAPEGDSRHRDRILRALLGRDRAHERLVGKS